MSRWVRPSRQTFGFAVRPPLGIYPDKIRITSQIRAEGLTNLVIMHKKKKKKEKKYCLIGLLYFRFAGCIIEDRKRVLADASAGRI